MKQLSFVITFLLFFSNLGNSCSMYKITTDGKTIVGNNEDWLSPNSQFWFVPGEEGSYGVMNVGLLNNFVQGAINEAGLVFDGFANPYLEVKNVEGKLNTPIGEVVKNIMQTYSNVRDVKKYLVTINLAALSSAQLVFVDRTGEYLIVEGDELIVGNESEKAFSNFYYSQVKSIEEVALPNVKNGLQFLKSTTSESSFDYCGSVMKSISNPDGLTQYSTIYDLDRLVIRVYLYHDYSQFVEIDLKEELSKEAHRSMIAEMFPIETEGHQFYLKYNDQSNPTGFVKDFVGDETRTEKDLVRSGYSNNINTIGYEWLYHKNDAAGAIQIFKYATEIMPNESNLFDSLGEAYFVNKNYDQAIKSYANSLMLDPSNDNAIETLERIRQAKKETNKK